MDYPSEPAAPATPVNASKPGRWKRRLIRAAFVLSVIVLCVGLLLKDHIRTLHSLRRVPGTKAYVMDYYVDYNMDEVRAHGIDVNHIEDSFIRVCFPKWIASIASSAKSSFLDEPVTARSAGEHCSTVVLRSDNGHTYLGRNFDYNHDACLILKIHGAAGVKSVALLDLHYLNLDRDDLDETNLIQRIPLLFAPYYLHDGMNEYGVAVSEMSVDGVRPPNDPAKPNIIQASALRLILDYARNADEAIDLLRGYNIHFVAETTHFMVADRTGKSAVIEFIDGKIEPTTTKRSWQICTNHQICGKSEEDNCKACGRYKLASSTLNDLHNKGNDRDVMKIMQSVSQSNWTMWSSVYDLTSGEFEIAYRQHFDDIYRDRLTEIFPKR